MFVWRRVGLERFMGWDAGLGTVNACQTPGHFLGVGFCTCSGSAGLAAGAAQVLACCGPRNLQVAVSVMYALEIRVIPKIRIVFWYPQILNAV